MERIIGLSELKPGERRSVFVDDIPALVVRVQDAYYIVEDVCSHDGQPLTDGPVIDDVIMCPRHGAKFSLKSGAALCMPATKSIRTFATEIRDDAVWAKVGSDDVSTTGPVAPHPSQEKAGSSSARINSAGDSTTDSDAATGTATATEKPSSTELDYIEALRQVIDPELMVNIVDLGLIYSVDQDEQNPRRVKVDMTLTSPACPAGPQLVQQSKMALERLHDIDEATINMVMSPPWTPERMTDDARDQLGIF